MRKYVYVLKEGDIPTWVFGTDCKSYATGMQMAKKVAEMLPHAAFAAFVETGHAMCIDRGNLIAHYLSF